ncbi:polysaccharide biosynthesis/export protein [mine drainage metagenome]|uniref:Polysaccharide biosynthesis/export protein n=1 Tax=mine drainage metagenome TaxID=410659 RepID=A0A1J5SHT7_9ZZZZ
MVTSTRLPLPVSVFRLLLAVLAIASAPLFGQSTQLPNFNLKAKPYRIMPTDKLRIAVVQESDLDSIARVDSTGCVNLKLVGQVMIAGMTLDEAEKAIQDAYRDQRYLRNPQVTINVEEYAPREVSIQGEVRSPGRYSLPVESVSTVLWLVTRAGGFTDTAKGTAVKVTRFNPDGTIAKVFVVDVESLIKGKTSRDKINDTSLELEPGDVVYVPQRII